MYAKWFFGFTPERLPVITFSQPGNRDRLLNSAQPGEVIVYVATQGAETDEEERGRVLGAAEIGRKAVKTEEVADISQSPGRDFENGKFRWPEAIPMLRAWRFDPAPLANEVFEKNNLPHNAQAQAVALSERDEAAIQALNWVEVELPETPERERQQRIADAFNPGPTKPGPVASAGTHEVTVTDKDEVWTYAARFGSSPIWKIGQTSDRDNRLRELNAHVPVEYLEEQWSIGLEQKWPTAERAQEMEQRVLKLLDDKRTGGERVRCGEKELKDAWIEAIAGR